LIFLASAFFLIVAFYLSRLFYRKELFNPLVVFFSIWFFALSLYGAHDILNLKIFHYSLGTRASILIVASFGFFLLGSLSVAIRSKQHAGMLSLSLKNEQLSFIYTTTKFILILFSIAVAIKYAMLVRLYGNPFAHLETVRNDFFNGKLSFPFYLSVLTTLGYLAILNLGVLIVLRRDPGVIMATLLTFALVFFNDATIGMRGGFLNFFVLFLSTVLITNSARGNRSNLRSLSVFVLACVFFMVVMTVIFYFRSGGKVTYLEGLLLHNYIYLTGPVPAYGYFLDHPWIGRLLGHHTFLGLYELADIFFGALGVSLLGEADKVTHYALITDRGPFNTAPYLTYFHSDFGTVGLLAGSFLLGLISSWLFFNIFTKRRIVDLQFAGVAIAVLMLSIRGIYTNGRSFWVMLFLVTIQHVAFYLLKGYFVLEENNYQRL